MQQKVISYSHYTPHYGEVFICDDNIEGIDSIHGFKGKKILNISGGVRKLFVFEDSNDVESIVSALHDHREDLTEFNGRSAYPIQQVIATFEGNSKIISICSGKNHNVILTQEGRVYTYGFGEYGLLGHGGSIFQEKPRLIRKLETRNIVSIACGMFHTLALSQYGDVYAWGRGFEGQLGIMKGLEISSAPKLVLSFYKYKKGHEVSKLEKKPMAKIACGAYHSMSIDQNGSLYCWGEARYGQTGTGKKVKEELPLEVELFKDGQKQKVAMAAGGFGHTVCLTTQGQLFTWGLNIKGQLGLSDQPENTQTESSPTELSNYQPTLVSKDSTAQQLPKFKYITCGFNRSFAIDDDGSIWAWGGGNLGFKDSKSERGPRKVTQNTEDRKFEYIVANEHSVAMFARMRTTTFNPKLCSSKGETELTLFGTGFIDTSSQCIKFVLPNKKEVVVEAGYDGETSTFYCKVPDFDGQGCSFPGQSQILVSLDGVVFEPYKETLLIYPSSLATTSIEPKSASINGNMELKLMIDIPQEVMNRVPHITVGFLAARSKAEEGEDQKPPSVWQCVEGKYCNGEIICKTPTVAGFEVASPFYHVDISLNSQQFTGFPSTFRFYDITNVSTNIHEGYPEGGYQYIISASGLYDSAQKKIHLRSLAPNENLRREVQALEWDKVEKKLSFKMPPLTWMLGEKEATPELVQSVKAHLIEVLLTLSGVQWVKISEFRFVDPPPPPPEPEENKKDSKKDTKKAAKK